MPATAQFRTVPNPFAGKSTAFDVVGIAPAGYPCLLIAGDVSLAEAIALQEQFTSVPSKIVPVLAIHNAEFAVLPRWEPADTEPMDAIECDDEQIDHLPQAQAVDDGEDPDAPTPAAGKRIYEVEHRSRKSGNHVIEEIEGIDMACRLAELREPESRGRVIIRRKVQPTWLSFGLDLEDGEFMRLPIHATKVGAADFSDIWDARRSKVIPVLWPEWAAEPHFELPGSHGGNDASAAHTDPSDELSDQTRIYEIVHCSADTHDDVTEEVTGVDQACKLVAIRESESLGPVTIRRKPLPEWRVIWIDLESGQVTCNEKLFTKKDVLGIWLDCKTRAEQLVCVPWPTWAPIPKIELTVGDVAKQVRRDRTPAAV